MRFLIADDDAAIRALVTRVLGKRGWVALAASSAAQLLEAWSRERPEAILSDVDMASIGDGLKACAEIRRLHPEARIQLMSGNPENEEEARKLGFGPLLQKPFTLAELADRLDKLATAVDRRAIILGEDLSPSVSVRENHETSS